MIQIILLILLGFAIYFIVGVGYVIHTSEKEATLWAEERKKRDVAHPCPRCNEVAYHKFGTSTSGTPYGGFCDKCKYWWNDPDVV